MSTPEPPPSSNYSVPESATDPAPVDVPPSAAKSDSGDQVILVSYPKIVFLYPTLIVSALAAIVTAFSDSTTAASIMAWLFLFVLGTNAIVISFDFPRSTSLTMFFIGMAVLLLLVLISTYTPNLVPFLRDTIAAIQPAANAAFYTIVAITLGTIYVFVLINRKFDYWEVKPNELLHHHGLMSDLKRYSAPSLEMEKEIPDLFEYLLLRSGRLILHPTGTQRSIVLENVLNISKKEKEITRMLSALQVKVRSE